MMPSVLEVFCDDVLESWELDGFGVVADGDDGESQARVPDFVLRLAVGDDRCDGDTVGWLFCRNGVITSVLWTRPMSLATSCS